MVNVNKDDLVMAIDMVSASESCGIDSYAYVCTVTGKVWVTGFDDESLEDQDLASDLSDNPQYIMAPDKREMDLGRDLVFKFIGEELPNELERVYGFFRRRGAYGKYKRLLEQHQLLEQWHGHEEQEVERALERWCEANSLCFSDL